MERQQSRLAVKLLALSVSLNAVLAGCGGGSGSNRTSSVPEPEPEPFVPPAALPNLVIPSQAMPALGMPSNVASGSVVRLQCGRVYRGTLDLSGKSNVTVRTEGDCGKAILAPGRPITGWTPHLNNIYSAPIDFDPAQVLIDARPLSLAHWPNQPPTWVTAQSSTSDSVTYPMPNADLAGATLVFQPFKWSIEARKIAAYANGVMTLNPREDRTTYDGYNPVGTPSFYVEGKLWMLDEPGEWAASAGRLYVWSPDGQSPEGRVWASPEKHGIEASSSSNISIQNIAIFGTSNAINAPGAANLHVLGVDIANSSTNGIVNTGGSGLLVDGTSIRNSRHDAITVRSGGGNERIKNSRIDAAGILGMPANAHAAINLTLSDGASVTGNTITNTGFIGIRFFRNAIVSGNTVDTACLVLADCGGIYAQALDMLPLNSRVDGNTIKNVNRDQELAWAIQIDDYANGVTVANNTMDGNANGVMIHNAFNITVVGNTFTRNRQAHIQIQEGSPTPIVRTNLVAGNNFVARRGETTYQVSSALGLGSIVQFAAYGNNTYANSSTVFANVNGEKMSFAQWQERMQQDASSVYKAP
ncbi:right-handed parallel beta-helix repeat-containing protein [Herbaspirillum sp. HC18]|nr:right-handed parallel beta-helix repeat-containing protein [Herbaspirillum sp. HC18]